jgi:hypothetical protein
MDRLILLGTIPLETWNQPAPSSKFRIGKRRRGTTMSSLIINLILQAIAGAIGGNAAAAGLDQADLGKAANTIAGAIGGVAAGQIVSVLLPTLAAAASGVDIKTVVAQLAAGGVGGAVTTVVVGMIKNLAAKS